MPGSLPVALAGRHQIRLDLAVAVRRLDLDPLGLQPLVVLRHLLRLGELRVHQVEQHPGGHAADGKLRRAIEESRAGR